MEESDFGERLKARRIAKKLSQDDVAKALGKQHRTTISNWEKGKQYPSINEVKRLAELLETTVGYLVEGTESGVPEGYTVIERNKLQLMQEELIQFQRREIERQRA